MVKVCRMKALLILTLLMPTLAKAHTPLECAAQIAFSESRGESVEGAVAIFHALYNRAKRMGVANFCKLKGVTFKKIPDAMRLHYLSLAKTALMSKYIVSDADSWNTGKEMHHKGDIKRQIGKHVFYRMSAL